VKVLINRMDFVEIVLQDRKELLEYKRRYYLFQVRIDIIPLKIYLKKFKINNLHLHSAICRHSSSFG
jgi:hypothetical protein